MAEYPVLKRTDVLPEGKPYRNPGKSDQESFNDPMNDLNAPVPLRKGPAEDNGWVNEFYDTNQDVES